MTLVQKIGYITIIFLGCQVSFNVFYQCYKYYFAKNKIEDLTSMGKWAIVTGCSHGIGKAFVETLAKNGLNIVLVSVNIQQFNIQEHLIKDIAENVENLYNIKTKIIQLNIVDGLEAYKIIEKEIVGLEIGILVNNFGQNYPHPEYFLDLPHNDKIYMNIIQCNIIVTTNMCRIILPQMVLRQKGVIVNVASSAAVIPSPLLIVYAATKAYILKFSNGLNMEYSRYGIIVQCLLPASVTDRAKDSSPSSYWISPTAQQYVENAIKTVGRDETTTGFFPHSIFLWIINILYKLSPALLILTMTSAMEINRNRAIEKYVC